MASSLVRNALHAVNKLGIQLGRSSKSKNLFNTIASSEDGPVIEPVRIIKPLCPPRFTVRGSSVQSLVNQYSRVLKTLQEVTQNYSLL